MTSTSWRVAPNGWVFAGLQRLGRVRTVAGGWSAAGRVFGSLEKAAAALVESLDGGPRPVVPVDVGCRVMCVCRRRDGSHEEAEVVAISGTRVRLRVLNPRIIAQPGRTPRVAPATRWIEWGCKTYRVVLLADGRAVTWGPGGATIAEAAPAAEVEEAALAAEGADR